MATSANQLSVVIGHGTGNDFILVLDAADENPPDAELIQGLCDRHRGLGADGYIRAVRTSAILRADSEATWFMDYRNADGTLAEMCGNGARVFAAFLEAQGLADFANPQPIATRAGDKMIRRVAEHDYEVEMGHWRLTEPEKAIEQGADALVQAAGLADPRPALSIDLGNPHTVLALASQSELQALNLTVPPQVQPVPVHGTNVEFVVPLGEQEATNPDGSTFLQGQVRMRVHERGVGETLSCGTGACAAAAAVRYWSGPNPADCWVVEVPGGQLVVTFGPDAAVSLCGPTALLATAQVDLSQLGQ